MHVDTPFKKIRQLIAERYDHTVTQILVFEGEIKGTELVQTNEAGAVRLCAEVFVCVCGVCVCGGYTAGWGGTSV